MLWFVKSVARMLFHENLWCGDYRCGPIFQYVFVVLACRLIWSVTGTELHIPFDASSVQIVSYFSVFFYELYHHESAGRAEQFISTILKTFSLYCTASK